MTPIEMSRPGKAALRGYVFDEENRFLVRAVRRQMMLAHFPLAEYPVQNYFRPLSRVAYLGWIKVQPNHRGKGVGTTLLREFLIRLKRTKVQWIFLIASGDDEMDEGNLVGWYRRFGFKFTSPKLTTPYGPLMRLWLPTARFST